MWYSSLCSRISIQNLEWRQPKGISTVLDSEDAHQEAVHAKNDRRPDDDCRLLSLGVLDPWNPERQIDRRKGQKCVCQATRQHALFVKNLTHEIEEPPLTHSSNDLRLHAILILETAGKVTDPTTPVACHIWHFSNMVEHVSAREQQNHDQTDTSPQVAVLNDRHNIRVCHCDEREQSQENSDGDSNFCKVDGTLDLGIISGWEMAKYPAMYTFRRLRTQEVETEGLTLRFRVFANGRRKEE